jgi:hypothetical protein
MGFGLDRNCSISVREKGFFSYPYCTDGLQGLPNLLSHEYMGLFPCSLSCRGVKLTINLHLVMRLRIVVFLHSLYDFMARCLIN